MKIVVSAESTIDLPKDLLDKYNIKIIPFFIILGNEIKKDGELSNQDIFNYVKNTGNLPKTSAINDFQYEEYFKELLKDYDEVIHITLSSELTSSYRNVMNAADRLNNKVHIIDSKSLSTGIALLAIYASELCKTGVDVNEIINQVNLRVPNVQASFVIENLDYLYKGGRCSRLATFGANLFHICPQIIVKDGKMDAGKKFRGKYFNVLMQYVDETLEEFNHPDLSNVFITFPSLDNEENIVNAIKEKLTKRGFKNIYVTNAGGTVACHCGPNTLGILYINDSAI